MRPMGRGWWMIAWIVAFACGLIAAAHAADCQDFDLDRAGMAYLTASAVAGGPEAVPTGPATPTFTDVPADYWAYRYVEYCAAQGIVHGYGGGLYQPDGVGTRAQMAVLVARALAGGDAGLPTAPATATFADVPVDYWAYQYVEYLNQHVVDAGLGTSPPTFGPDLPMSAFTAVSWLQQTTGVTVDACPIPRLSRESLARVSTRFGGGEPDGDSGPAAISADGRFVAFASAATDLVPDDENGHEDIFLYDRETKATTLMSASSGGAQGDQDSDEPALSAGGRFLAFASLATNLAPDDTNFGENPLSGWDIFVCDRVTGETERVSLASDGAEAHGNSRWPSLSADGRYVAFESDAADLVPDDTNGVADIFVYDRVTRATRRVSTASDGTQADGRSAAASISANGRVVAFWSEADNLVPGDTNDAGDVFVKNLDTGPTERVSVGAGGAQANAASALLHGTVLSAGGRCVVFASAATDLTSVTPTAPAVYLRDRVAQTTELIGPDPPGPPGSQGASGAGISGDGRFVAFFSRWHDFPFVEVPAQQSRNQRGHIGSRNGQPPLASAFGAPSPDLERGKGGEGGQHWQSGPSTSPLEPTGASAQSLAWRTQDLRESSTGDFGWVYLTDRVLGTTTLVSTGDADIGALSRGPALSADGRTVAFESLGSGSDDAWDVFLRVPGLVGYGAIGGTIVDAVSQAPVPGAAVWVDGALWADGSGGVYRFPFVLAGESHTLTVSAPGYLPVSIPDVPVVERLTTTQNIVLTTGIAPPVADFTATPRGGTVPLTVTFTDASTGSPTAWSWDFGDGDVSTQQNPIHTYRRAGYRTVTLTALTAGGSDTKTQSRCVLARFADVPKGYWAEGPILACAEAGIVSGYPDGTYQPAQPVTREQMAVYVARAMAGGDAMVPTGPAQAHFPDVPPGSWAYRYVEYAWAMNVAEGFPDGAYGPTLPVDRAEMAVYMARAVNKPNGESALDGYTPPTTPSFPDVPTDYWAYKYVEYVKSLHIVAGYPDGTYHPADVVTRDQMAVYVARAFVLTL